MLRIVCWRGIAAGIVICLSASAIAQINEFTVTESSEFFSHGPPPGNNVNCVHGDAAPGYGINSLASNGIAKSDLYFPPEVLFDREVFVEEVASISYYTKTGATHDVDYRDWFLNIYTKPFTGDVSTPTWYGARFGAVPYTAANLNDPANTWNQWSTEAGDNQLRFFESTQGAPGAHFETYADPDFVTFISQNVLGTSEVRADQPILFFSIQTASSGITGFEGQVDGLRIELLDGSVAEINFECDDSDNDGIDDDLDHCPLSDFRPFVNVGSGNTSIANADNDTIHSDDVNANGCTIQDLVNDCIAHSKNHGQYVSCITQLANDLYKQGAITKSQREEMKTGAAKSGVGK